MTTTSSQKNVEMNNEVKVETYYCFEICLIFLVAVFQPDYKHIAER